MLNDFQTLLDAFLSAPPDKIALTIWRPDKNEQFESFSFGYFFHLSRWYARIYRRAGLKPGDTVILIMAQGLPLMASFVGAMLNGAIPTILAYPTFKIDPQKYRDGLQGVTNNLRARLVVLDKTFPYDLVGNLHTSECAHVLRVDQHECDTAPFVSEADSEDLQVGPNDVAFIQHSGGTTGLQKGVALSHAAVLDQLRKLADALTITDEDRIVSWLPLYHDMGLIACFVLPIACHVPLVLLSPTDWVMRPASMLRIVTDLSATLCWLPNFAFQFMARRVPDYEKEGLDLRSLRALINCSEPVLAQSMEEFLAGYAPFGLSAGALQSCYAMAENTFAVTQSNPAGGAPRTVRVDSDEFYRQKKVRRVPPSNPNGRTFTSSGQCLPGSRVRVVDADCRDVPEGHLGQILIHSESMFDGYYNRSDLTAKAIKDGWFLTRDEGFLLEGELFVVGRQDDVIIVGGKNLYPHDIEEIACAHPSIHDGRAVAFGLFRPDAGTQDLIVVAESVSNDVSEPVSIAAAIRQAIVSEIGVSPRVVEIVSPMWIVKSSAGKPARSTNRQKFVREHPEYDFAEPRQ